MRSGLLLFADDAQWRSEFLVVCIVLSLTGVLQFTGKSLSSTGTLIVNLCTKRNGQLTQEPSIRVAYDSLLHDSYSSCTYWMDWPCYLPAVREQDSFSSTCKLPLNTTHVAGTIEPARTRPSSLHQKGLDRSNDRCKGLPSSFALGMGLCCRLVSVPGPLKLNMSH